ncbi:MAG: Slp family lipoprotein [Betaproteobacteria bacterium]
MIRALLATASLLLLTACATTPTPISRGPFTPLSLKQAQSGEAAGSRVRWGGMIISVAPQKSETCFEVLSRPLDGDGEPKPTDQTEGRFIACGTGFYDPAAYPAGREITFVGSVQSSTVCKIGTVDFSCPSLAIESLYLWPKPEPRYYYYDPFYDPFWGPWPYRYPYRIY